MALRLYVVTGSRLVLRAICMLFVCGLLLTIAAPAYGQDAATFAAYNRAKLADGAKSLPISAAVEYRAAINAALKKDFETAEKRLQAAIALDPGYPDPYFTLAALSARRFDSEAPIYLMSGLGALWRSFEQQGLLLLNTIVIIPYVWFLISLVVCFALALRYLPFAAHKVKELLQGRLRAAAPGLCAYLLLLLPLVVVPGVITALAYLTIVSWMFMYKRERSLVIVLMAPFIVIGLFGALLRPLTPVSDPMSVTSLVARANDSHSDPHLERSLKQTGDDGLDFQRNVALGLINYRGHDYTPAADYLLRAINERPDEPIGYINLGNVYFRQGLYQRALEGYRKADGIDPSDPVCQHALAQAFIKTLLMKESSKALQAASALGIERIRSQYARGALDYHPVLPKTFSNRQLWSTARAEARAVDDDLLDEMLVPFTRFPRQVSAWILLGALVVAMILARLVPPSRLTFQCGNCGQLTCSNCCNNEHEMELCQACAATIHGITSDKVAQALLRQKRQSVLVSRRKWAKFFSFVLPGIRDISYGRIRRGFFVSALFAFSVVQLFSKGYIVKDPLDLVVHDPLWKLVLPVAGVVIAYLVSIFGKQKYDAKTYRAQNRHRMKDKGDNAAPVRVA